MGEGGGHDGRWKNGQMGNNKTDVLKGERKEWSREGFMCWLRRFESPYCGVRGS